MEEPVYTDKFQTPEKIELKLPKQRHGQIFDAIERLHEKFEQKEAKPHSLVRQDSDLFKRIKQETSLGKEGITIIASGKGSTHIYGLSFDGNLYHLKQQTNVPHLSTQQGGYTWNYVDVLGMQFRDISVTKEGKLFAVSYEGHLFRFDDANNSMKSKMAHDLRYKLTSISAIRNKAFAHSRLFALADDGTALTRTHNHHGKSFRWEELGTTKLKHLTANVRKVHRKGEIWGITYQDHAVRFKHSLNMWIMIDPMQTFSDLSIGRDDSIYGILKSDNRLVKYDGNKFVPVEAGERKYKKFMSLCVSGEGNVLAIEMGTGDIVRVYDQKHIKKGPVQL
jgi:hypothetical protein